MCSGQLSEYIPYICICIAGIEWQWSLANVHPLCNLIKRWAMVSGQWLEYIPYIPLLKGCAILCSQSLEYIPI